MKIYVARHGQTQWNAENKVCGRTDIPLTETGLQQAEKLADNAEGKNIDIIVLNHAKTTDVKYNFKPIMDIFCRLGSFSLLNI